MASASPAHAIALWRSIIAYFILVFLPVFLVYHTQNREILPVPCVVVAFATVHRYVCLLTVLKRAFVVLLVDIVLSLVEAGVFAHRVATIKWSVEEPLTLYEGLLAIACAFFLIVYVCISILGRVWSKANHEVSYEEFMQSIMFPGESKISVIIRLGATAAIMVVLASYSLAEVVIEPVRENKRLPVKEIHSQGFPSNLWTDTCQRKSQSSCKPPSVLNVVLARPSISTSGGNKSVEVFPAVQVVTFDDGTTTAPSCNLVRQPTLQIESRQILANVTWDVLSFGCTYNDTQPQILVTASFTRGDSNSSSSLPFLHIMIGNTNDTEKVLHVTESPAVIFPGENVVSFAKQHVLRRIKSQVSSTFGVTLYENIIITALAELRPDPQTSKSPLIVSAPDFASIRIVPFLNMGDWKIMQEYRDKSVLKGLSILGGLWTLFANCFALIFGISVMRALFHTKTLSISGLVHLFHPSFLGRDKWSDEYKIGAEKPRSVQDFMAFMVDHFVDVGFTRGAQQAWADNVVGTGDEEINLLKDEGVPSSETSPLVAVDPAQQVVPNPVEEVVTAVDEKRRIVEVPPPPTP